MAGSSMGDEDNPVAINVTPLIDVIFCLCVFFMCSFRFKQLEGKFDTWLPKDKGNKNTVIQSDMPKEVRIALFWDKVAGKTIRRMGDREVRSDEELQNLIRDAYRDLVLANHPDAPVTIDAQGAVPWNEVMKVVNMCKREKIEKIEFALGAPPPQ
ncbi:MAG: biopolymer transporter ExbD [Planctomycetes bacterium]|nr:biopolymer transporter ExbD [Planctomycetota bacterium]